MAGEQCRHCLSMGNAAAERNRCLPIKVPAVVANNITHDGADPLLSILDIKITHPLTQSGSIEPRRRQHLGSS